MTLQDLKKAKMQAMKAHDADTVAGLNVVITKLMILEKSGNGEISEQDVIAAIRKSVKELQEEREGFIKANRQENVDELTRQIAVVEEYLPKQLSVEEVEDIIDSLLDKSIPVVMRHFKTNYAGVVDMKMVSEVLKKK